MLQCLQEFPEAVLLIIDMQSLLVEEDVWSHQTWKTTQKGHNFWSDRCIALKFLQAFPEGVFRGVAMESLLGEDEVWLRQTGITAQKGPNF